MKVQVLDTSALVEFLVGSDTLAERVRSHTAGNRLAAPHVVDLECASVLRGLVRGNKLPEDEATRALDLLGCMQLHRYDHTPLMPRIWELRHNMWPYDASYIALAETLDAELVTADRKLAGAPGLRCTVTDLRGDQRLR
ncbi:type II toxin-antitoxin system VapC family toxin [Streptomyces microflavus]|uniref:Type II toxin-antitoxin system VapC family toxin n=1 Tax=Streptomyces microflavus TaxID=1919 RepID=A0A7H8MR40_STRMI|nr:MULTISPECIES: type II toxin-antitoxin system VapC family toxin [Streptomyces]MBW3360299.1 type II toxin-antitoxin system VapC family toxin [Streptomyces sp. 09ZI22]QKW44663.1 type II toxin-antitoxin system VapC family toxin [Streptomyces microflavus]